MRKISGLYLRLAVCVLLVALLAACGSKATTTITSSTNPSVIYVHSVAFKSDSLYAWGANTYGQLGNGDNTGANQYTPIQIPPSATFTNANVVGVSAGATHTLAFKNDLNKTVWAWGNNGFGQVGNNSTVISWTPVQVVIDTNNPGTPLTGITAVSAGWGHSLALDGSNHVWAWGDNTFGELGVALTTLSRYFAAEVNNQLSTPLSNIIRIAAGGAHNLALDSSGEVWSWGNNDSGQLGYSSANQAAKSPIPNLVTNVDTSALSHVVAIAAGGAHSLFILNDGTVWACGHNLFGQLGQGGVDTTDRKLGVVQVTGLPTGAGFTPIAVAAGRDHSLVLMDGGSVWAWGYNYSVGNGVVPAADAAVTTPVQVLISAGTPLSGITKIVAIGDHSLALNGTTGQLWAWGVNSYGQLGQGGSDTTNRYFATPVAGFSTGSDLYAP